MSKPAQSQPGRAAVQVGAGDYAASNAKVFLKGVYPPCGRHFLCAVLVSGAWENDSMIWEEA